MKAAEMKIEKLDNRDVIATSTPAFANKFTLSGLGDGEKGFSIDGKYGDKTFNQSYKRGGSDPSEATYLMDFLGASGKFMMDADLPIKNSSTTSNLGNIYDGELSDVKFNAFNGDYMWDAINEIFTYVQ